MMPNNRGQIFRFGTLYEQWFCEGPQTWPFPKVFVLRLYPSSLIPFIICVERINGVTPPKLARNQVIFSRWAALIVLDHGKLKPRKHPYFPFF
jgi:hypothetical protein